MKKSQSSDYFNRLEKGLGIDEEGNVSVGKNLEADGNIFTLNGKQWGIMPVIRINVSGNYVEEGFILSDVLPFTDEGDSITVSGIWYNSDRSDSIGLCPAKTNFPKKSNKTRIENGILYVDVTDIDSLLELFPYIVTQLDLPDLSEFQGRLYRHVITLVSDSMYGGSIVYITTSNLKVEGLQDLTTLLKPSPDYEYPLSGICSGLDSNNSIQIGTLNAYIKSFDRIIYKNNLWYFSNVLSDKETIDTVSDIVTSL